MAGLQKEALERLMEVKPLMVTAPWWNLRASVFCRFSVAQIFRRIAVGSKDVKALKLLSADLQKELQYELCLPYLMRTWAEIRGLCHWASAPFDSLESA